MAEIDGAVGEPPRAREFDVVGAHHFEHLRAHQAHDQGELEEAERDRGQDQRLQALHREEIRRPAANVDGFTAAERR